MKYTTTLAVHSININRAIALLDKWAFSNFDLYHNIDIKHIDGIDAVLLKLEVEGDEDSVEGFVTWLVGECI